MYLTILMPCLNESETLRTCIVKAQAYIAQSGESCEILIADNGSTDGSQEIAKSLGVRVLDVPQKGYGAALYHGVLAAQGRFVIMGDSDDSYDFSELEKFTEKFELGYDLVMGNRFMGGIQSGAMPWKNRYIGNPFLTWVGQMLFQCPVGDFHCGLRGFSKEAFMRLDLRTTGMEFASEMVIKASLLQMRIIEVPTKLAKDGRSRPPHLRPWRDGWRHLRFMLLFSPRWLFFYPGLFIFLASLIIYARLIYGSFNIAELTFDIHTLFFAQATLVMGYLTLIFGVIVRLFGMREGLLQQNKILTKINKYPILEIGSLCGLLSLLIGVFAGAYSFNIWRQLEFGSITTNAVLRIVSLSTTLIMLGGITVLMALMMGFISLPARQQK